MIITAALSLLICASITKITLIYPEIWLRMKRKWAFIIFLNSSLSKNKWDAASVELTVVKHHQQKNG